MSQIAAEWSFGELDVLMSTTMGLVGNENPSCRHLVCIGYLYDSLQLVQFLGRLRNSMQKEFGKVMFAVPNTFSGKRIMDDNLRYTRLLHEGFVSDQDHINFNSVLTSSGVRNWLAKKRIEVAGNNECATQRVLSRLASSCLVCNKPGC